MSGKSYETPASVYQQRPPAYGAPPPAYGAPPPAYGGGAPVVESYAVGGGGGAPVATSAVVTGTVLQAMPIVAAPMVVTVPPNVKGGMALAVQAPDGRQMQVTVPPGLAPGQQFTVQFPPAAATVPVGVVVGAAAQTVSAHVVRPMGAVSSATKRCRGCGIQFELDAKTNPASAAAFRCKKCRGFNMMSFF